MKIIAYSYTEPLLEAAPAPEIWGQEVDRTYQDLGGRQQLQQLLKDCQTEPVKYLLIQRFEELGDTLQQVCSHLAQLENLGLEIIVQAETEPRNRKNLLQILAELQRSQHSRSIRKGHARNRIKSRIPPGKAPTATGAAKSATRSIDRPPPPSKIFLNTF